MATPYEQYLAGVVGSPASPAAAPDSQAVSKPKANDALDSQSLFDSKLLDQQNDGVQPDSDCE